MHCLYFLTLSLLFSNPTQAQPSANDSTSREAGYSTELDKRHGFLGIPFDTPLTSFKELHLVRTQEQEQVYRKKAERKAVGEATIKYVDYYFYKGKLSAVQVHAVNDLKNKAAWMELLKTAYQVAPSTVLNNSEDSPGGSYFWHGKHTHINYSAYSGKDLSIYVSCADITAEKACDRVTRVKRAAEKL
ncbi:hypothetical protein [Hymenobacter sp. GOD-10R]|uniref:hypothetical protein n=1 Tax=Hymenobacter sp. GOD-10R TaxID=3093922 RepID=UPI002D7793A2|nr:hypothetical protein [Hymenobacter sp. GOD-10R]WRQ30620.1 hypothetical protein SD425_10145 [Hymenobacter sp. GOD-10R]